MGMIQGYEGDYYGGQESLLKSLSLLDERKKSNKDCLLSDYNELGRISNDLKNYDNALDYYNKALPMIKNEKDSAIALNNKGVAFQGKGDYNQAADIFHSALDQSKNYPVQYARTLSNYAKVKWLLDTAYNAAPEMLHAMQIRKRENDSRGLNASYAHLSDYHAILRPDSALIYANKMYETAKLINNPDDEIEALTKLINLSPVSSLKQYFTRYQYLTDSMQIARNAAKNQFALVRYDAEKNKVDNLQLQKDNAQKELQIITLIAITLILLTFIATGIFLYRKRKQRIEFNARHAIQEHQLKTSQKVHDVVANGLYTIMTAIEHQDIIEKEPLLDKIEILYEQSRDISYEQPSITHQHFQNKIAELLASFASVTTKVLTVGNTETLWANTSAQTQLEIEQILQELMVNMKKHSRANNVIIKFERLNGLIHIQYTDNGVGIPNEIIYGNGLTNTENRIKMLGGQITFDRTVVKGLKIRISFPTA